MSLALWAGLFLAQAGAPPASTEQAMVRSLLVTITDEKGRPAEGLSPEEVVVLENGLARDIVGLLPDRRPLTVAVLLDTSANMNSDLRMQVLEPLVAFLMGLPSGSKYALWTTGDRPLKLVDYTSDPLEASQALKRVPPQGGNTVLDALVEASADLKKKEGERSAVVAVTKIGIEFSSRDRFRVVEQALANAPLFMAVKIDEGGESFESLARYDYVLGELTRKTGGVYETVLTSLAVGHALERVGAALRGQYRLRYATVPEIKERKLEVKVSRPGVRVRIGPATVDHS
ncbi:MAG TPA: VWA domain-containing protein [Vicinamibacteria bacterium]|jgi:VWFA-related protein|nr:VWA domain-containing protein [Vicinamibacteria bacterium]